MAGWVIRDFKGLTPKIDPRLLSANGATVASNCVLESGKLRPLRGVESATNTSVANSVSLYRFDRDRTADDRHYWFGFNRLTGVVKGAIPSDTEETTIIADGNNPRYTRTSLLGSAPYPTTTYSLGLPVPAGVLTAVAVGQVPSGDSVELVPTSYAFLYTYVSSRGWEGPPSAAASVDVLPGQNVNLYGLAGTPSGAYEITSKRIYRAEAGVYRFIKEVPVSVPSVTIDMSSASAEAIPSLELYAPPNTLDGIVALPNGVVAGFSGFDVYFSEPYMPHAYPPSYMQSVDAQVVGLAAMESSLLVLTNHYPYIVSGTHPSTYGMSRLDVPQACSSRNSIAASGGGVIYASPDGMVRVSGAGGAVLTEGIIDRDWWQARNPAIIHGVVANGKYYGFWRFNGGGFILDLQTLDFTTHTISAMGSYYDAVWDTVYISYGTAGNVVGRFDRGSALTATWRSKTFYMPSEVSLGALRVEAESYSGLVVRVYGDGVLLRSVTVISDNPMRLPAKRCKEWFIEVDTSTPVYSVSIAETVGDLRHG